MEVKSQVMIEGNLDLCATDYRPLYSFACCYTIEGGVTLEGMMAADQDCLYVFDVANIEKAVAEGNSTSSGSRSSEPMSWAAAMAAVGRRLGPARGRGDLAPGGGQAPDEQRRSEVLRGGEARRRSIIMLR